MPKGPSTEPSDKRLAVPTEDHPIAYGRFEGTIPAGEYGGGTVLVWDHGRYTNTTRHKGDRLSMAEGLARGHVTFELAGEKLRGGYALTRFRAGDDEAWLLVKESGAGTGGDPVRRSPESVLSGRTMEQIAEEDR